MLRSENVASPLPAATGFVPDSAPPPWLLAIASVTLLLADVTRLPPASRTSTCTGGGIVKPDVAFAGWTRKPRLAAGPTATSNPLDGAARRLLALAASVM